MSPSRTEQYTPWASMTVDYRFPDHAIDCHRIRIGIIYLNNVAWLTEDTTK
jgi:hypothetical protein